MNGSTVLAYDPPQRVLLSWHLNGEWGPTTPTPARASEVEVRFIAEGPELTRVESWSTGISSGTARAGRQMRDSVGASDGWSSGLRRFAEAAGAA